MSETETPLAGSERPIQFRGREIWVKIPDDGALLVWQRTVKRLDSPEVTSWNGHQALAALERARRIIDSMIVNRVDRDWLDDEMIDPDNPLNLEEAAGIILLAVEAFGSDKPEPNNRAEKRAAAPKKKAQRKVT